MSRVKLNLAGFTQVRRSPEVRDAIETEAQFIASDANAMASRTINAGTPKYSVASAIDSAVGSIALVTTRGSLAATIDNAKHNTLLKAMGGG